VLTRKGSVTTAKMHWHYHHYLFLEEMETPVPEPKPLTTVANRLTNKEVYFQKDLGENQAKIFQLM